MYASLIAESVQDALRVVLPLPLHTTSLRPSSLREIFAALETLETSAIPPPAALLVPPVGEVKAELEKRRAERRSANADGAESEGGDVAGAEDDGQQADDELSPVIEEGGDGEAGDEPSDSAPVTVNEEIDKETLYMAIVTQDSTVVYYKLSKGIKKPADIPDE